MSNTVALAPVRQNAPYVLSRDPGRVIGAVRRHWREVHWEEAMWLRWHESKNMDGLPWRTILTYQMMLRNDNGDESWGEVDLVGVDDRCAPVVIELKSHVSKEIPFRAVVEAAAYGVAMKKAWDDGELRTRWEATFPSASRNDNLKNLKLAVVAPVQYWNWCFGRRALRSEWSDLINLVSSLESYGFVYSFIAITHEGVEKPGVQQIPIIVDGKTIDMRSSIDQGYLCYSS